jgi:hypothetical protein
MTDAQQPADVGARELGVDDHHVHLPRDLDLDRTYDILLNGDHVWSLQPRRDAEPLLGRWAAPWPRGLRRHLVGMAEVVLRDHADQRVEATGHHVFQGDASRTVSVTDHDGNALILDKYGRLTRPLSAEGADSLAAFLDKIEELLAALRDVAGRPSFICYGTLLGAARSGTLIGHDNDVDIAYLSEQPFPVDVIRESHRIERVLRAEGWTVRRGSGNRVNVRLVQADGSVRYVDVFTAHWVDGRLYMPSDTGFELPRESILPLTTVPLHGRPMPAPADYERLLELTYGPGWRTPDPSFKYDTPRWLARRLNGWFGGLRTNRKYWDAFYARSGRKVPTTPTPFARWVDAEYPSTRPLVDLGTGNCRDARYFAKRGRTEVLAIDYTAGAMRLKPVPGKRVTRQVMNLNDIRHVLSLGVRLSRSEQPVDLYARFLLHSLDADGRENVLRLASMSLRRGGRLFLEFRTLKDRGRRHVFPTQKRDFLDPDDVVRQVQAAGGRVVRREEGLGLARFDTEDPYVCRLVVTWSDTDPDTAERSS